MVVSVFVISMDPARRDAVIEQLPSSMSVVVVDGVDGATHRTDKRLTTFCRHFCTDRIVGCALAHADASQAVVDAGVPWALVLEDDVVVTTPSLEADLVASVRDAPEDWDIIVLFCQGICSHASRMWNGSTAAYLLSQKGASKLATTRIGYHADFIRNSMRFETRLGPSLFTTRDPRNHLVVFNQELGFFLKQDLLQVGRMRLQTVHIVLCYVLLAVVCLAVRSRVSTDILVNVVLPCVLFPLVLSYYMTYETQHYRSSATTSLGLGLGAAFVLCIQGALSNRPMRYTLVGLAVVTLVFQGLHAMD